MTHSRSMKTAGLRLVRCAAAVFSVSVLAGGAGLRPQAAEAQGTAEPRGGAAEISFPATSTAERQGQQAGLQAPLPRSRPQAQGAETAAAGTADVPAATAADVPAGAADVPEEAAGAAAAVPPSSLDALPLPRQRPAVKTVAVTGHASQAPFYGFKPNLTLKDALDAVGRDRFSEARRLAAYLKDPLAVRLVDWLIARAPESGLSAEAIMAVLETHQGWPEAEKLRVRAEESFHEGGPGAAEVLAFYRGAEPVTIGGRLALATALSEKGQAEEAERRARALWREERLGSLQAALLLTRFGLKLTRDDHLYRFRRLVLQRRAADAAAQSKLLGPGYENLAKAVLATLGRNNPGQKPLKAVASSLYQDPLYIFASARQLRRDRDLVAAARMMLRAPRDPALLGDGDVWWDERRDLSRGLLDQGAADLAYRIAAEHSAASREDRAEAEFHAGWYALRFLDSPAKAEPHFRKLAGMAKMTRTKARALYWLGRTYEANGRILSANALYSEAGAFGGNYYGQLAREKIGLRTTGVERVPQPTASDRVRFANREAVRAIRLLAAGGHTERAFPFFKLLAETIDAPGEITLAAALARRIGQPRTGMVVASLADQRGIPVGSLSLPFLGVPAQVPLPEPVDRALVYAVARQESALNAEATSQVGARGLMQLMPTTAKATARNIDLPFSLQRLNDPLYNATLGAQHLGELLDQLDQSYILTFVGYNAGPGRARQWVRAYGDPRGGQADAVDWVERIPFDETRNYVQKVMENLQVYRSRLGRPLSLSEDLVRGGPEG